MCWLLYPDIDSASNANTVYISKSNEKFSTINIEVNLNRVERRTDKTVSRCIGHNTIFQKTNAAGYYLKTPIIWPSPLNKVGETFRILFCWNISREMFKGRSSESTMPFTKPKYSGMISSQLSMIKTRRTYCLILFCYLRPSNISKGAFLGTSMTDLNSNCKSNSKLVRPQELCTSKTTHNYWVASSSEGSWHIPHLQAWQGNANNCLYISILLQAS